MSLRAILEIVVHLDSFRNIDLFFQGLYYVKVSVHNKKGDEVRNYYRSNLFWLSYTMQILTASSLQGSQKRNRGSSRVPVTSTITTCSLRR